MVPAESSTEAFDKGAMGETKAKFIPVAVRMLADSGITDIDTNATTTFNPWFLHSYLNPQKCPAYTNGFFIFGNDSQLPSQSLMTLDNDLEPFGPDLPGKHGAKISPVSRHTPTEDGSLPSPRHTTGFPLFVRAQSGNGYLYFGTYTKVHGNDRLGFDTSALHVPDLTKQYWAKCLTSAKRPAWMTEALKEALLNKPVHEGPLPGGPANKQDIMKGLQDYADKMKHWDKLASEKAAIITVEEVLQAMNHPTTKSEANIQFSYEYLQCVGYDHDFYNKLVTMQAQRPDNSSRIRREILNEHILSCGGGNRMYKDGITFRASKRAIQTPPNSTSSGGTMARYINSFLPGAKLPPKPLLLTAQASAIMSSSTSDKPVATKAEDVPAIAPATTPVLKSGTTPSVPLSAKPEHNQIITTTTTILTHKQTKSVTTVAGGMPVAAETEQAGSFWANPPPPIIKIRKPRTKK
ncbi:hypothetical protein MBLNU230_g5607t1 [Neophaeotheca triangularis]